MVFKDHILADVFCLYCSPHYFYLHSSKYLSDVIGQYYTNYRETEIRTLLAIKSPPLYSDSACISRYLFVEIIHTVAL